MVWNKEVFCVLESAKIAKFDICHVTKGGHIEHLQGSTENWSISPSVNMLPFGVTIPVTVPQRSEIPEGLMNNPVYDGQICIFTMNFMISTILRTKFFIYMVIYLSFIHACLM
jgi:hypothetical protein